MKKVKKKQQQQQKPISRYGHLVLAFTVLNLTITTLILFGCKS
jgi:hypothetical protein